MKYWYIIENRKQAILHLFLFLILITISFALGITLGVSTGLQSGLILSTIILSTTAYIKQFKSTIEQSVERLPRIKVNSYVIKPMVFDLKTWGDTFTTLQFKMYKLDNGEIFPADMEEFLNKYFENPEEEFDDAGDITQRTEYPARVDIEWTFLDAEGLRIRTNSFESTQLRRLAEQTMYKIYNEAKEQESEQGRIVENT